MHDTAASACTVPKSLPPPGTPWARRCRGLLGVWLAGTGCDDNRRARRLLGYRREGARRAAEAAECARCLWNRALSADGRVLTLVDAVVMLCYVRDADTEHEICNNLSVWHSRRRSTLPHMAGTEAQRVERCVVCSVCSERAHISVTLNLSVTLN